MPVRASTPVRNLPAFNGESTPAERLAACKAYLTAESERIHQRHKAGDSGLKVAQAQAAKIDRLLQQLSSPPWNPGGKKTASRPPPSA